MTLDDVERTNGKNAAHINAARFTIPIQNEEHKI